MNKSLPRIIVFLYLIINILFVEKYASRVTEYHLILSLVYTLVSCCIIYILHKKWCFKHTTKYLIGIGVLLLFGAIAIQYAIDPFSLQVDRWSAIHNFLAAMLQGDYPYGQSTHLEGYGSPFPVWQILHLPFYLIGNVGLSIFIVTIVFIATLYYCHSSKVALIATILLGISPAFWYEIAVRSDLITNMLLVATIVEWLIHKNIKLSQYTIPVGIIAGLILSTRLIAIIPICVIYGYEFLHIGWKKQLLLILTTAATFALTFLPFLLWEGSTLLFFQYNPFVLQTRQGSWLVLCIFAIIAIAATLLMKNKLQYRFICTGVILSILVSLAFVEKMWQENLWGGLFSSAFDITYLSTALPFYIGYLASTLSANNPLSTTD